MMRDYTLNSNKTVQFVKKRKYVFLLVFMFATFGFLRAGQWLVVNQAPQNADIIIVLSGGEERMEVASKLLDEGYSNKILLTNVYGFSPQDISDVESNEFAEVIYRDDQSTSTLASAKYSKKMMEETKLKSALIVSSEYHMRRVKMNYERTFKGNSYELTYIASDSHYHPQRWWADDYSFGVTGSEYIKMIGNSLGIHGAWAKRIFYGLDHYFL